MRQRSSLTLLVAVAFTLTTIAGALPSYSFIKSKKILGVPGFPHYAYVIPQLNYVEFPGPQAAAVSFSGPAEIEVVYLRWPLRFAPGVVVSSIWPQVAVLALPVQAWVFWSSSGGLPFALREEDSMSMGRTIGNRPDPVWYLLSRLERSIQSAVGWGKNPPGIDLVSLTVHVDSSTWRNDRFDSLHWGRETTTGMATLSIDGRNEQIDLLSPRKVRNRSLRELLDPQS